MIRIHGFRLGLVLSGLAGLYACSEAPKGDNASITEKQEATQAKGTAYIVDTTSSRIRFTGRGVGKNHPGIFKLSSGRLAVGNNQITGGDFVINIGSMDLEQKGGMYDEKLRPHLLSKDFFDADHFPTARFEITKVESHQSGDTKASVTEGANFNISGNLTLKDVTKNITFPARIDMNGNTIKARGSFDIDRRQWDMNYGNDKSLGDKFISETVNIELTLEADKQ